MWYGIYSTLVAHAVPVGKSRLVISRQMRCPFSKRFAVDRISTAYSLISPGGTGFHASRVWGCQGFQGLVLLESRARCEGLSQPLVSSLSGRLAGTSVSPSRAVCTETSGPTSLRM